MQRTADIFKYKDVSILKQERKDFENAENILLYFVFIFIISYCPLFCIFLENYFM